MYMLHQTQTDCKHSEEGVERNGEERRGEKMSTVRDKYEDGT